MSGPLVAPFSGWMVKPEWADRVISRAFDNITPSERRAIIADNPYSYVNVTRSHEDFADDKDCSLERLVTAGSEALQRLLDAEVFTPTGRPALYLYKMSHERGEQTGVICTVSVDGVDDGRIRLHENVRESHTALLTEHLLGVGAASNPAALAVQSSPQLLKTLNDITSTMEPELSFGSDVVHHEVWTVPTEHTQELLDLLENETLYVTDGHHRLNAGMRARAAAPDSEPLKRTLAAIYPTEQLDVEAFHRIVADCRHDKPSECFAAIAEATGGLKEVASAEEARPQQRGEVGVYVGGEWYRMKLPAPAADSSAVEALDVELLRNHVLDPLLGADELSGTGSVDYLSDLAGTEELVTRCQEHNRIGFVMHPVSIGELINVADEDGRMPPKSSFFNPKPRSGAFMYMLARGATAHLPAS